jgi:uncharacterized protein (TIGR02996 family)
MRELVDRIEESPYDYEARLVYADWLEEQGQTRDAEKERLVGTLLPIIYQAWDRNILVYDCEAAPGSFTKRVASLAKVVFLENLDRHADTIYLDTAVMADFDMMVADPFAEMREYKTFMGLEIRWVTGLNNPNGVYLTYFKEELAGAPAPDDDSLFLVGSVDTNEWIIGSY